MTETKHTPGPWRHDGQGDITGIERNGKNHGAVDVCSVYLRTVRGRTEANARLIAAAPDLLEALQACDEAMAYMSDYDIPLALPQKVKAAIAKATGGKA